MYMCAQIEDTIWDENGDAQTQTKEAAKEITTHVAIHTMHLDGLRELYRHFLRLPDGAVVEVSSQHFVHFLYNYYYSKTDCVQKQIVLYYCFYCNIWIIIVITQYNWISIVDY